MSAIQSKNSVTLICPRSSKSDAFLIIWLLSYDLARFFFTKHRAYKLRNCIVLANSNRSKKCRKLKKLELPGIPRPMTPFIASTEQVVRFSKFQTEIDSAPSYRTEKNMQTTIYRKMYTNVSTTKSIEI